MKNVMNLYATGCIEQLKKSTSDIEQNARSMRLETQTLEERLALLQAEHQSAGYFSMQLENLVLERSSRFLDQLKRETRAKLADLGQAASYLQKELADSRRQLTLLETSIDELTDLINALEAACLGLPAVGASKPIVVPATLAGKRALVA